MTRYLITGAAGMLGSHLVARLAADGHDVVGIDLREDPHPPAGARHIVADIRDGAALARAFDGAHALVHCAAALPSYPVDQIRSITVDGTRAVLTAAHRARVERRDPERRHAHHGERRQRARQRRPGPHHQRAAEPEHGQQQAQPHRQS